MWSVANRSYSGAPSTVAKHLLYYKQINLCNWLCGFLINDFFPSTFASDTLVNLIFSALLFFVSAWAEIEGYQLCVSFSGKKTMYVI